MTIYHKGYIVTIMKWSVDAKKKVQRQVKRLPEKVKKTLAALLNEIQEYGPYRTAWLNYGSLGGNRYHCHLKKGHPTYVAIWEVVDKKIKIVEVTYAGTHEKAPY